MATAEESQSGNLEFAPIRNEHLDRVMEIELEAYPEPWTRGMFREEIRSKQSYFYVVFHQGVLMGYGGFWLVLDEAHITSVTVRKAWRSKGYGRKLVQYILEKAVEVGARIATLEVRVSNTRARNLYLRMGFSPIGLRKDYYPKNKEDAVVMLKELV